MRRLADPPGFSWLIWCAAGPHSSPQELLYTLLAVSHAPQPELLLSGAAAGLAMLCMRLAAHLLELALVCMRLAANAFLLRGVLLWPSASRPPTDGLAWLRHPEAPHTAACPCAASHAAPPLVSTPTLLLPIPLPAHPCARAVNVAGFIYVQDVDVAKGTITYLAPCAGALPNSLLLAGAFKTYLD